MVLLIKFNFIIIVNYLNNTTNISYIMFSKILLLVLLLVPVNSYKTINVNKNNIIKISGEIDERMATRFSKPNGFNGIHKFEINELSKEKTEIKHTIDMNTYGKGTLMWTLVIRPLHNALIQDAFDKIENNFSKTLKLTKWNFWVRFLRIRFHSFYIFSL